MFFFRFCEYRKLFIALRSLKHTHIDVISPDGRGAHYHMLEEELGDGPIALVPDFELKEMFWADFESTRIAFTDFDGN